MKLVRHLPAAMLLWIFIACNHTGSPLQLSKKKLEANVENKTAATVDYMAAADSVAQQPTANKQPATARQALVKEDWDKKIIKTGDLTLEVKNYSGFSETVHAGMKKMGGYIAREEQHQSFDRIENTVTIKVPVEQFDAAVEAFTPATEKIVEKKINAEDVTAELVDTKMRLDAKKHVRDRYLDLLKQAKNMDEILQVQNEVNGIQENIEAAAGRINYLGHEAVFSTIHITYYQLLGTAADYNAAPSYGYRLLASFKDGLHGFSELLVILVSLWPLWTGVLAAWWVIRKKIKTNSSKSRQGTAA